MRVCRRLDPFFRSPIRPAKNTGRFLFSKYPRKYFQTPFKRLTLSPLFSIISSFGSLFLLNFSFIINKPIFKTNKNRVLEAFLWTWAQKSNKCATKKA